MRLRRRLPAPRRAQHRPPEDVLLARGATVGGLIRGNVVGDYENELRRVAALLREEETIDRTRFEALLDGRHAARAGASELADVAFCGALAAGIASVFVLVLPRGGDLAAHLYRTDLVRHGILVWDNLWFAGQYPLSSYSLLYYPLAALVGNAALGIGGVAVSAAIFASVARGQWSAIGRWPARLFALLLTGQAFTAAYPFDVGLAALLAALWALQRRRLILASVCTVLTLGFSPLAFLFLVLALTARFLNDRKVSRHAVVVGVAAAAAVAVQLALLLLMPTPGLVYPYGLWPLLAGLAVCAFGVSLSTRGRRDWLLASLFSVWAAASIALYLVPTPVGHNLARASIFAVPLMLVAAARAGFRPRWLVVAALTAAAAANVLPYVSMIPDRSATPGAQASFWRPVLAFLDSHRSPQYRVEVVPTANHWEAYYLPRAGFALARGWYRQLDIADDGPLYARNLTPERYRAWLRSHAVEYAVVPRLPLEAIDATREGALLRSGSSGLVKVWSGADATVYKLPHPTPIVTGPGAANISTLGSGRIVGRLGQPGTYLVRVRFMPFWQVVRGSVCVSPAAGSMTRLKARRAGPFAIAAIESPDDVLAAILRGGSGGCG